MTILGWMHHKFGRNVLEIHNDFYTGLPPFVDLRCYPRTNFHYKPLEKLHSAKCLRNSFSHVEAATHVQEESSAPLTKLFHRFPVKEPITIDPSTPTFSISIDHIAENKLKLIKDELEKVLGDESCNISLGRNSHVSDRSSGQISINFVLSEKQVENGVINENIEGIVCPLLSYLFGSAIGSLEIAPPAKKDRTSLRDLFQKTKVVKENLDRAPEKQTDKSPVHMMNKMMMRKMLNHTSSQSSSNDDSRSTETKLCKIQHMFHRKILPESSTDGCTPEKPAKNKTKGNFTSHIGHLMPKESTETFKSEFYQHQLMLNNKDAGGKGEHWIKTDKDYLVLEL